jgi:GntR family transcriptional regulator
MIASDPCKIQVTTNHTIADKTKLKKMLRDKAIPLYYQIETILRQKILSGEFLPASPLPSEDALAEEYNVSRITIRQALSLLKEDGLVVRQRGKGTFVSEQVNSEALEPPKLSGSIEDLILMGIQTTTKTLNMSMVKPPDKILDRLKLARDSQLLRIEKIRLVEQGPLSYVINYLPPEIGKKIKSEDLQVKPLMMILEDKFGITAAEADQTLEATIADAHVAPLLEIRVGDPLLKVERTVFDGKGNPIEYVSVLYRADKYFFHVKLKRQRSETSIGWRTI